VRWSFNLWSNWKYPCEFLLQIFQRESTEAEESERHWEASADHALQIFLARPQHRSADAKTIMMSLQHVCRCLNVTFLSLSLFANKIFKIMIAQN
jgi:hypothetical protein